MRYLLYVLPLALFTGCAYDPYYYEPAPMVYPAGYEGGYDTGYARPARPYYSRAHAKGYVSSYQSEQMEAPAAPQQQFYVSASQNPQVSLGMGQGAPFTAVLGMALQRTQSGSQYYTFVQPQLQMNLTYALDHAASGQPSNLGMTRDGSPIRFIADSQTYQTVSTNEWCRAGYLEAPQTYIRGTFCRSQNNPWALLR